MKERTEPSRESNANQADTRKTKAASRQTAAVHTRTAGTKNVGGGETQTASKEGKGGTARRTRQDKHTRADGPRVAGMAAKLNPQAMSLAVEGPPRPGSPAPQALEQRHQDHSGDETRDGRYLRREGRTNRKRITPRCFAIPGKPDLTRTHNVRNNVGSPKKKKTPHLPCFPAAAAVMKWPRPPHLHHISTTSSLRGTAAAAAADIW